MSTLKQKGTRNHCRENHSASFSGCTNLCASKNDLCCYWNIQVRRNLEKKKKETKTEMEINVNVNRNGSVKVKRKDNKVGKEEEEETKTMVMIHNETFRKSIKSFRP